MKANKAYRKYSLILIGLIVTVFVVIALFNCYFDPLLLFDAIRSGNRFVPVIDSRIQKTNHLLHGNSRYNAILLGSSRSEQLRQEDFLPFKLFNYAVPNFCPDEVEEYLDFFLQKNGSENVIVFIGLDFYGSNSIPHEHAKPPRYYLGENTKPLQRFLPYLGRNALKYSFKMLRNKQEVFKYDRSTLDKVTIVTDRKESERLRHEQLNHYAAIPYHDYVYNPDYYRILQGLKNRHSNLDFVVFTTPVTTDLFHVLVEQGRLPDFEHWLKDIVNVFGTVYNLMPPSDFNADRSNFIDAHHLDPARSSDISSVLSRKLSSCDRNLGILLTRENIDGYLRDNHRLWQSF